MDLSTMLALVRQDLHDTDSNNYRWTDADLERHIAHAVKDYSAALPLDQVAAIATTGGSREVSLAGLTGIVTIEAVEFPIGRFPPCLPHFALWNNLLVLFGDVVPDGSNCRIYYGRLHTLDNVGSTLPACHEDLVAAGACGYAALQIAGYSIDRVNTGGLNTPVVWAAWGKGILDLFRAELKRLGRRRRVCAKSLFRP
jgi:hypothetical protein